MGPLGRRTPTDFEHVERYPLTITTTPAAPVPVTIGVDWFTNFDNPVKDSRGRWWIGRGDLGSVRGGHCVCLEPGDPSTPGASEQDIASWWGFYDQGREGACVGFGSSRMMSLLNRKRYDARWLWNRAKEIDEWPDTNPGDDNGTSVRAALDVLRERGHVPIRNGKDRPVSRSEGIAANRWANSVDDVLKALGTPERDYVVVLNSWGLNYPRKVRLPADVLERLRQEDGELAVVTDL